MFEYEVCNGTKEGKDLFTCRQDLDARLERLGSSEISIELVGIEGYEPTHVPFWSGKVVVFCAHVSFQSSKSSPFLPWSATLYLSLALIALKPRTQQSRMDGTGGCGNLGYRGRQGCSSLNHPLIYVFGYMTLKIASLPVKYHLVDIVIKERACSALRKV